MEKIRIGIIGAGANTRLHHLPRFQAIEGVSVDVVCNRSRESSQKIADEYGIPRIAEKWEDVVSDPEIDAICIGTWPYLHAPITIEALRNGKHVLTEARMAMNAEQAQAMLDVSQANPKLVAQIVPAPMTLHWDETIRQILDAGELGDLREIEFVKAFPANADSDTPMNWRQNIEYSGNNTIMLGIYYEVIQRWLKREPNKVWASGQVFTCERENPEIGGPAKVEVPETIDLQARYSDGLRLLGRMSGLEYGRGRDAFLINGSKGSLKLDLIEGTLYKSLMGSSETIVEVKPEFAASWNVEVDFIKSIRETKPVSLTSFADGVKYMKLTDAAIESSKQGGAWVSL